MSSVIHPMPLDHSVAGAFVPPIRATLPESLTQELSWPAKSVLMAAATLMIGFSTLGACRGNDLRATSRMVARGDTSLAYSALSYITWPKDSFADDDSPFVLAVLGKPSELHEKLQAPYLEGKKRIHGRAVQVHKYDNLKDISQSHVLLVSEAYPQKLIEEALKAVDGKSVLTIGETNGFAKSGGVLGVVKNGDNWILELSQRAAAKQRLKVDVRLVNVSVLIDEDRGR